MKLTKLKKVIEYANAVALVKDKQNRQWISDGISWYAIEGLPEMQIANLQQLLGIEQKKWVKLYIDEGLTIMPGDLNDMIMLSEQKRDQFINITPMGWTIETENAELVAFHGDGEIVFFKKVYMCPINNDPKIHFLMRYCGKGRVLLVMDGIFCIAAIPECIMSDGDIIKMNEIAMEARSARTRWDSED